MYSKKYKSIIKSSLRSLTAALSIPSLLLVNIDSVQAQLAPGYVTCHVSSISDINFKDISLVNPVSGTQTIQFKPACESSYYKIEHSDVFQKTTYTPHGSACIGISSTNSAEKLTERFLYLGGDTSSSFKLPFNFYFTTPGQSLPIGNGTTESGIVTRGWGSASTIEPAVGAQRSIPIFANMIARFDFTNQGLPVGAYTNTYNVTLWTGAWIGADNENLPNSICQGLFPEVSGTRQIKVTVNVLPSCRFQILEHVNFGQHTQLTSNMTASGKLGVTCNNNASYEIQLDGGRNKDVNNRTMSLMANGVYNDSQKISYNLFLPNSTTIWGTTKGTNTYTAMANDSLEHSIEVRATINPASNPNPAVGIYRDTVTATIIY